ncbi:MAG: repeat-containing protein [Chthoniobacteraceae bacterium]|nr:repeat-containing protein [Chthoniobacteraceae bacterium]
MADEEPEEPAAGTWRFGDYEIIHPIARGGMGTVYCARQISLNRTVALKIISAADAAAPDFLERFRTEAEVAASLHHPHIVPIYDFGQYEGQYFLTMQLISGGAIGKHAIFAPANAVRLVTIVARAVHYAHQRGILHRDIKPGNILLDEAGVPYLADFGLAKLISRDSAITRTFAVIGTPSYMSPEQATGRTRDITTAADVYGIGAVLYDLLAGTPPFVGATPLETMRAVIESEPPRLSPLNPAVDRDLETICLKCLEKDPARRYGSAEALADDLDRWQRREPILARAATGTERLIKWVRRHRAGAAILGAALFALLSVTVVSTWMNIRLSAAQRTLAAHTETRRRELVALHVATGNRLAEDGDPFAALDSFAEAARLDADAPARLRMHGYRFALTLAHAPQLELRIEHAAAVASASFSPDGNRIATACADGTAHVWDALTGAEAMPPLLHTAPLRSAAFSTDGALLGIRAEKGETLLLRSDTGAVAAGPWPGHRLLAPFHGQGGTLAFSQDGRWLAVPGRSGVLLHNLSNEMLNPQQISVENRINQLLFSPDSSQLAILTEGGGAQLREFPTLTRVLEPTRAWRNGAWSPDGTKLALADNKFRARIFNPRSGEALTQWLEHEAMVAGCRFSPNGRMLLTWSFDNNAQLFDSENGRALAPPMRHHGPVRAAVFSPDGNRIATASADGTVRLWNGSTGETLGARLPHASAALDLNFSSDGERVLTASADGAVRVWKIPANGYAYRSWANGAPVDAALFSPDGTHVAAFGFTDEVRVWNYATGEPLANPLKHPSRALTAGWLDAGRLATLCSDRQFRIWEIPSGKLLSTAAMPTATDWYVQGGNFVSFSRNRAPELWNPVTGELLGTLDTVPGEQVKFNSDGRQFVAVWHDKLRIGRTLNRPATPLSIVPERDTLFAALSDDGQRVAVAYLDYTVRIYDSMTGAQIAGPLRHTSGIRALAFTPDGTVIATGSDDRTLRLWDVASGEPLGPPLLHGSRVVGVSSSPDGRAFATACSDGIARVWKIPPSPRTAEQMARIARRLNARGK